MEQAVLTAHELAKRLLEGPDLPVFMQEFNLGEYGDQPCGLIAASSDRVLLCESADGDKFSADKFRKYMEFVAENIGRPVIVNLTAPYRS